MKSYQLYYTRRAQRDISKLPSSLYIRFQSALKKLSDDPFNGKKLKGEFEGHFSMRFGDNRIIYLIRKSEILVIIVAIGHRNKIYKHK